MTLLQLAQDVETTTQWSWVSAWDGEAWALAAMYAIKRLSESWEAVEKQRARYQDDQ